MHIHWLEMKALFLAVNHFLSHQSVSAVGGMSEKTANNTRSVASTETKIFHPNPQVFSLTACLLSTDHSRIRDFGMTLENSWRHHGDQE